MHNLASQVLLAPVDIAFAQMLARQQPAHRDAWLLAALTSHAYREGHACLTLNESLAHLSFTQPNGMALAKLSPDWFAQESLCTWWQKEDATSPLIWQENRLYLRRAWQDEQSILQLILQRLAIKNEHMQVLTPWLDSLFGLSNSVGKDTPDWQRIACALATRAQFSIITGGPGTGKTTTVVRLLSLLQRLAQQQPTPKWLQIGLSAPTGKAAARLASSIQNAVGQLAADFQFDLPTQAQTLHKWLASDTLAQCDCFIIDEASMIDLHLMAELLRKLPLKARLILLGDKDQLASVDAGAVLGQLCQGAEQGNYRLATQDWLTTFAGQSLPASFCTSLANDLAQQTIMLRHSHRFDVLSDIGRWAGWVNQQKLNDIKNAYTKLPTWADDSHASVVALPISTQDMSDLKKLILTIWQPLKHLLKQSVDEHGADDWAKECLGQLSEFQLLCALREGRWGLNSMNQRIAHWLGLDSAQWTPGRVIMVTRNDYSLNLMNGDIGLCLKHPHLGIRVVFASDQGVRWILPARLSYIEDAFAMSVHKSQGSEFKRVLLLLPDQDSPILTKELIYTAITRAKQQFLLAAPHAPILWASVGRSVQRAGGLNFDA